MTFRPEHIPSRRSLLKSVAAALSASNLPILGQLPPPEKRHTPIPPTKSDASPHEWIFFQRDELASLDALTEAIIPTDDHSPGATAARVSEYIDIMVADGSETSKLLWRSGLKTANEIAMHDFGERIENCTAEQQDQVVARLAGPEEQDAFFVALKRMTIDGYYTSYIGIHDDLQYQGNQAMAQFPGCTQEHEH